MHRRQRRKLIAQNKKRMAHEDFFNPMTGLYDDCPICLELSRRGEEVMVVDKDGTISTIKPRPPAKG